MIILERFVISVIIVVFCSLKCCLILELLFVLIDIGINYFV